MSTRLSADRLAELRRLSQPLQHAAKVDKAWQRLLAEAVAEIDARSIPADTPPYVDPDPSNDLMADEERDIFVHDSKAYEAVFWGSDCDACGGNTTPDSGICDSCGNAETHHLFRLVRTPGADPT